MLELRAVGAGFLAQSHEFKSAIKTSVMIRGDVGNEVRGLVCTDESVTDAESRHCCSLKAYAEIASIVLARRSQLSVMARSATLPIEMSLTNTVMLARRWVTEEARELVCVQRKVANSGRIVASGSRA